MQYKENLSQIAEYLLLPVLLLESSPEDLAYRQKVAGDQYDQVADYLKELANMPAARATFLTSGEYYFSLYLLQSLAQEGESLTSFREKLENLSQEEALKAMYRFLTNDYQMPVEKLTKEALFDVVDQYGLGDAMSLKWVRAILHPQRFLVDLSQYLGQVAGTYEALYATFAAARASMVSQLQKPETISQAPLALKKIFENQLADGSLASLQCLVLSPYFRMAIYSELEEPKQAWFVTTSAAYSSKRVAKETFANVLKALADENRYQVLRLSLSGQLKAKEIAAQLGISPAAVSYHVNQLMETGLMFHTKHEGKLTLVVNSDLLNQVMTSLKEDLGLNEPF